MFVKTYNLPSKRTNMLICVVFFTTRDYKNHKKVITTYEQVCVVQIFYTIFYSKSFFVYRYF